MLERIQARSLLYAQLDTLPEQLILVFDDGVEVITKKRKVIYSNYFWEFHRQYNQLPLLAEHFIDHVLQGKAFTADANVNLFSILFNKTIDVYNLRTPLLKEPLLDIIYAIHNKINNEVVKMAEEHVSTLDILDFIEIMDNPTIHNVVSEVQSDNYSITNVFDVVREVINKDSSLAKNNIVQAVKAGMVNANQVLQCVSVVGFRTEVSGSIMPIPVMDNFATGLNSLYDFVVESRSAAKSLMFAEAPLQDAEYFARRLQLLTMSVETIDNIDCGTTKYLDWRVKPPAYNEKGIQTYRGDLVFMTGKYYLDDDNKLKVIGKNSSHLNNKLIKMRSVLFCKHPNPHVVCEVCFGKLSDNISAYDNLGHLCAATMTEKTSQSVLSTKHLDFSSSGAAIILDDMSKKFFNINRSKDGYLLKKDCTNIFITISKSELPGLIDILTIPDIRNVNTGRVSEIESIDVTYTFKGLSITETLSVSHGNKKAVLSLDFLRYLKEVGWETNENNDFKFQLSTWDTSLTIFRLPNIEFSFSDHSRQVSRMIEASMGDITERETPESPASTLVELFNLVNTKLSVNIAALEVILYAIQIYSKDNFTMGRNSETPILGISNLVITSRSLSNGYAYKSQASTIYSPKSFFKLNRPDSCMDVFILPKAVVDWKKYGRK